MKCNEDIIDKTQEADDEILTREEQEMMDEKMFAQMNKTDWRVSI